MMAYKIVSLHCLKIYRRVWIYYYPRSDIEWSSLEFCINFRPEQLLEDINIPNIY